MTDEPIDTAESVQADAASDPAPPKQVGGDQERCGGSPGEPCFIPADEPPGTICPGCEDCQNRASSVGGEDTHLDPDTAPKSEQSDSGPKLGEDTQARCESYEAALREIAGVWPGEIGTEPQEDWRKARARQAVTRHNRATPDPPSPDTARSPADVERIRQSQSSVARDIPPRETSIRTAPSPSPEGEELSQLDRAYADALVALEREQEARESDAIRNDTAWRSMKIDRDIERDRADKAEAERDYARKRVAGVTTALATASTEIERLTERCHTEHARGYTEGVLAEADGAEAEIERLRRWIEEVGARYDAGIPHHHPIRKQARALLDPAPPDPTP